MKNIFILITAILFVAIKGSLTWFSNDAVISNNNTGQQTGIAVVELFTSEGCSSCPPADAIAAKITSEFKNVYVLGFHVDYWNSLGWKDEFSNAAWTNRQQQYASHFELSSIYTPQMVVNGKTELVGSNEQLLRKTI